jgi:hypothetical protein
MRKMFGSTPSAVSMSSVSLFVGENAVEIAARFPSSHAEAWWFAMKLFQVELLMIIITKVENDEEV